MTPARFSTAEAEHLALEHWGLRAHASPLPSYIDQNFRLEGEDGACFVLKLAHAGQDPEELELECAALAWLAQRVELCPRVLPAGAGQPMLEVRATDGSARLARLLSFLPGTLYADVEAPGPALWASLGSALARTASAFEGFEHPAMGRVIQWDLARAGWIATRTGVIADLERRGRVERALAAYLARARPHLAQLRAGVVHNDANDNNLLVEPGPEGPRVAGLIDFGDLVHTATVCDLAIALAYAVFEQAAPLDTLLAVVGGYHAERPLFELELEVLLPLVRARLAVSVVSSAEAARDDPQNSYAGISEERAWSALARLEELDGRAALDALRTACGFPPLAAPGRPAQGLGAARARVLGPSLSLAYREPLKLVRGSGQYLFDVEGRAFLDCVNNVCHVGHCHPRVVRAGAQQMALLNTNTRYLHDTIVDYAERLAASFPDPLGVVFFVNSGSEANELALRMARAATGRRDVVVVDGAYHGNTSSLVDLSPYKHDGPGGEGAAPWVRTVSMPDAYRGAHRDAGPYADEVARAASGAAAFLCESILSCGGQIVLPAGYLEAAYAHVRAAGGVCIADEVQVGFGRVGTHMWAFETQGVVPDIVTLGKPMGNGHPLAAVVTTAEIAAAFDNGMEYFNTFGGNPVSCAIGSAVLDVIEDEGLRAHALEVGGFLLEGLRDLATRHASIGDVRGLGLFLGVQFVADRSTKAPDAALLARLVEFARGEGILFSSDGPQHDVLKLKPPLCFTREDAALVVACLERGLALEAEP